MASMLWLSPVIGWFVTPLIIFLVNKFLSYYLDFNLPTKLQELELRIIPSLKQRLGGVTEERMLRAAEGEGKRSEYVLASLGKLDEALKSALYDAEDILDLVEYRRIEKKVVGDLNWVLRAIGYRIAGCKRSSFEQKLCQYARKLQQCILNFDLKFWDLVGKLPQYAQNLKEMFRDLPLRGTLMQSVQGAAEQAPTPDAPTAEFRDDIEQGTAMPSPAPDAPSTSNPPTPNSLPNSAASATEFNQHGSAEEALRLDAPSNALPNSATEFRGTRIS